MKQITKTFIVLLSTVLPLIACNKEIDSPDSSAVSKNDGLKSYKFTLSSGDSKATKSLISPDGEGIVFNWESTDNIGTYSDAGKTEELNNASGSVDANANPITFEISTYVDLTAGSNVYCYYPYSSANNSNNNPASVTLTIPDAQIQVDDEFDSSAMPLVSAPYTITSALDELDSTPVGDISFYNLGSVIELDIYSSTGEYEDETVTGVTLEANKAISGDFTFNLKGVNPEDVSTLEISGYTGTSVSVDITADDLKGATNRATAFRAYLVVAPGESVSGTITVTTDVTTYQYTLPARDFKRATLKKFGLDLEKSGARVLPATYNYSKVTSAPSNWTGEYVITNPNVTAMVSGVISSSHLASTSVSKNLDGSITLNSPAHTVHFELISGSNYAIKVNSNDWLGYSGSTNFSSTATKPKSSDTPYLWTISVNASGVITITNVQTTDRKIMWNGTSDFRPYQNTPSGGGLPLVYQQVTTPLDAPILSISNTGKTINVSWNSNANAASYDVNCTNSVDYDEDEYGLTSTSTSFTVSDYGTYTITVTVNPVNSELFSSSSSNQEYELLDPSTPFLEASPNTLVWSNSEYGVGASKVVTIKINSDDSWSITSSTMSWATISEDHTNNRIAVYPNTANSSFTTDNSGTITIHHSVGGAGAEDIIIDCTQKMNSYTAHLTQSEITANITATACSYGTEKSYNDTSDEITWVASCYTDAASRPWMQIKSSSDSYIKIVAPKAIQSVTVTITSTSNSKGGVADISKHTEYSSSGTISLATAASEGTTVASESGSDIVDNKITLTPSGSNSTLYIKVSTGARIWGVDVVY